MGTLYVHKRRATPRRYIPRHRVASRYVGTAPVLPPARDPWEDTDPRLVLGWISGRLVTVR